MGPGQGRWFLLGRDQGPHVGFGKRATHYPTLARMYTLRGVHALGHNQAAAWCDLARTELEGPRRVQAAVTPYLGISAAPPLATSHHRPHLEHRSTAVADRAIVLFRPPADGHPASCEPPEGGTSSPAGTRMPQGAPAPEAPSATTARPIPGVAFPGLATATPGRESQTPWPSLMLARRRRRYDGSVMSS